MRRTMYHAEDRIIPPRGARAAVQFYGKPLGRMLAYAIAGHHAGLADSDDLDRRLHPDYEIKPIGDWEKYSGVLPSKSVTLPPMHFDFSGDQGFSSSFLVAHAVLMPR